MTQGYKDPGPEDLQHEAAEIDKEWLVVDARTSRSVASPQIAGLLRGKHKPTFSPISTWATT
jgi:ribosomal protein L13